MQVIIVTYMHDACSMMVHKNVVVHMLFRFKNAVASKIHREVGSVQDHKVCCYIARSCT